MASQFSRCYGQNSLRLQAQTAAQAVIAQGRQARSRRTEVLPPSVCLEEEEEPINRYIHVFTRTCASPQGGCPCQTDPAETALLERAVEVLTQQNQLLIDLLAAVNSLTAATLGIQARMSRDTAFS